MGKYVVRKGLSSMDYEAVKMLLKQTYWANQRTDECIQKSMENSICYGVFEQDSNKQIGFARALTDYATSCYLCDVIIDENLRGSGLGRLLMEYIKNDPDLKGQRIHLVTKDDTTAFYKNFGFSIGGVAYMSGKF